jgi:hypothetical protein
VHLVGSCYSKFILSFWFVIRLINFCYSDSTTLLNALYIIANRESNNKAIFFFETTMKITVLFSLDWSHVMYEGVNSLFP